MSQRKDDEGLLPPWVMNVTVRLGPLVVLAVVWWLLSSVFRVPERIWVPVFAVLVLVAAVYFGGRYYKPFYVEKKTGRCIAKTAKDRKSCRRYMPGARLGGGCGRLREDRGCRYVKG
jgi:hypothetical protein